MSTIAVSSQGTTVWNTHSQFSGAKVEEWYSIASRSSSDAINSLDIRSASIATARIDGFGVKNRRLTRISLYHLMNLLLASLVDGEV